MSLISSLSSRIANQSRPGKLVVVCARAGSGKTTTLVEGLKYARKEQVSVDPTLEQFFVWYSMEELCSSGSVRFVAFNSSIAESLKEKLPQYAPATTLHKLGKSLVESRFHTNQTPNRRKTFKIISRMVSDVFPPDSEEESALAETVSKVKQTLTDWENKAAVLELMHKYDIDRTHTPEIMEFLPRIMEASRDISRNSEIDFDDMIWIPATSKDISIPRADCLVVDEFQDLNKAQQKFVSLLGRNFVICGDDRQSIYGFAGSETDGITKFTKDMECRGFSCVSLSLLTSRRCSVSVIKEANKIVPDIRNHEDAEEGEVKTISYTEMENLLEPGDMVLCRFNAPLICPALARISAKKKAFINGKSFGDSIVRRVKTFLKSRTPSNLSETDYCIDRINRTLEENYDSFSRTTRDLLLCSVSILKDSSSISEFERKVKELFSDNAENSVMFSSIHKAKGLEANRVFILKDENFPEANSADCSQESNVLYVAITRAKSTLFYVMEEKENDYKP